MHLHAVRKAGCIVDFSWDAADATAARLMAWHADALHGMRLTGVIAGPLDHPALVDNYRHVVEHGSAQSFAQVHSIDGRQDIVIHRVVRMGDGVTVALTNLSANRRVQALRLDECAANVIEL
jgi:tryptophan synthase beta subunit